MRLRLAGFFAFVIALLAGVTMASPAQAAPGPFYWIVNVHSGKALMPLNDVKDFGAEIVQYTKQNNRGAQNWKVQRDGVGGSGPYVNRVFLNRHSKWCISAPNDLPSTVLTQRYCHNDGLRNIWQVSNVDDMWAGRPFTVWNKGNLMCLDVGNASTADFARIVQYPCHGGANQVFKLAYVQGT